MTRRLLLLVMLLDGVCGVLTAQDWVQEAMTARQGGNYQEAISLLRTAVEQNPSLQNRLLLAETMAWNKELADAGKMYREILGTHPGNRDALLGLSRVLLWEAKYRQAKQRFAELLSSRPADIDAKEGSALASYWSGDYRTAAREFRGVLAIEPGRAESRKGLLEIEAAARHYFRLSSTYASDNQPLRTIQSGAEASLFSDPLTRWDIAAGLTALDAREVGSSPNVPMARLRLDLVVPSISLSVIPSLAVIRSPVHSIRPLGGLELRRRLSDHSSLAAHWQRNALFLTARSVLGDPFVDLYGLKWSAQREQGWSAAAELEQRRYFDGNQGGAANAYVLGRPLLSKAIDRWWRWGVIRVVPGLAVSYQDSRESRFGIDGVSGERVASGGFRYRYAGLYDPYWTPHDLKEGRAILEVRHDGARGSEVKLKLEGGVATDRALGFGPDNGSLPLPSGTFSFFTERRFHPWRAELSTAIAVSKDLRFEARFEHSSTVFYEVNSFHATVVGRF